MKLVAVIFIPFSAVLSNEPFILQDKLEINSENLFPS